MSLLTTAELKEQQKINELEKKIQDEKDKLDKKVNHQKIVLGEFFLDMLEKNAVNDLKKYTIENLSDFLTRKSDKESFESFIDKLKNDLEKKANSNNTNDNANDVDDVNTDDNANDVDDVNTDDNANDVDDVDDVNNQNDKGRFFGGTK